jgi:hypothetical protein
MVDHQIGLKNETTYGQAVTVDRFFEFLPGDPIALETGRVESGSLRAGQVVMNADRFLPYRLGAAGSRQIEVLTLGFDWWLLHMLGDVQVSTDTPVTGADTHVATIGNLCGTSFTYQENVPLGPCQDTNQAFTFSGGKIASWTLSCETEGVLTFEADMVFADMTTGTALATASYPAGAELFSWAAGKVEINDVAVPVTSWTVSCDNMLKTDRHYIAGAGSAPSYGRREPVSDGYREITVEFECDRTDLALWNRFAATLRANTLCKFEAITEGPQPITGSTYPKLAITVPALRVDDVSLGGLGLEMPMQSLSGVVRHSGTNEPITIDYVTES